MRKYQQGDVLFKEVPEDQWEFEQKNSDVVNEDTEFKVTKYETVTISVMKPTKDNNEQWMGPVKEKDRLEKDGDSLTVAFGEVTGHSHTFRNQSPDINIISYGITNTSVGETPKYIRIKGDDATITHEEHKPLSIPPGHYAVSIVQEWDHMGQFSRSVVD